MPPHFPRPASVFPAPRFFYRIFSYFGRCYDYVTVDVLPALPGRWQQGGSNKAGFYRSSLIDNGRMTLNRVQIVALVVSGLLALAIFQLMRKKRLKEQYSLLWFLTVAVMLLLAVWESLLSRISNAIGISIPSNALFIMALLFLFVMALHFSLLVSRLTDQTKILAQKLALLERDLRRSQEHADTDNIRQDEDSPVDD